MRASDVSGGSTIVVTGGLEVLILEPSHKAAARRGIVLRGARVPRSGERSLFNPALIEIVVIEVADGHAHFCYEARSGSAGPLGLENVIHRPPGALCGGNRGIEGNTGLTVD